MSHISIDSDVARDIFAFLANLGTKESKELLKRMFEGVTTQPATAEPWPIPCPYPWPQPITYPNPITVPDIQWLLPKVWCGTTTGKWDTPNGPYVVTA